MIVDESECTLMMLHLGGEYASAVCCFMGLNYIERMTSRVAVGVGMGVHAYIWYF